MKSNSPKYFILTCLIEGGLKNLCNRFRKKSMPRLDYFVIFSRTRQDDRNKLGPELFFPYFTSSDCSTGSGLQFFLSPTPA
jgi:hypothetical protein